MRKQRISTVPFHQLRRQLSTTFTADDPLIRIKNALFYRHQPSSHHDPQLSGAETARNPSLFPNLEFELPANDEDQHWCVVGPSNSGKTTFLQILQGQHLCFPPLARSYPYLTYRSTASDERICRRRTPAIQYVGFSASDRGFREQVAHMGTRYESRREVNDFSVLSYITGSARLNASASSSSDDEVQQLSRVIVDLELDNLLKIPFSSLSNGQKRRAKLAKAILKQPELLLLDEPFMGLDPPTTVSLSPLLHKLARTKSPRLVLALRTQDPIPDWISHVVFLGQDLRATHLGTKDAINKELAKSASDRISKANGVLLKGSDTKLVNYSVREFGRCLTSIGISPNPERLPKIERDRWYKAKKRYDLGLNVKDLKRKLCIGETKYEKGPLSLISEPPRNGEPMIEMSGVVIRYGRQVILGDWQRQLRVDLDPFETQDTADELGVQKLEATTSPGGLWWTVRRGERWTIIGPNGSGKTTLLSLILSDHPQSYSAPLRIFGRARLPSQGRPGLSLFDIQSRMGHSSPEVHSFFPRHLTVRQTLESAFAETPRSKPNLSVDADRRINSCLRWFQEELNPGIGLTCNAMKRTKTPEESFWADNKKCGHERNKTHAEDLYEFWDAQADAVEWADELRFDALTFSAQRVALFIRAIVAQPDVIVLDEAFSGMDDIVREKCILFLEHGESTRHISGSEDTSSQPNRLATTRQRPTVAKERVPETMIKGLSDQQALIVVSHVQEEIPQVITDWLFLPKPGSSGICKLGRVEVGSLRYKTHLWDQIWSSDVRKTNRISGRRANHLANEAARDRLIKATNSNLD